jgi:hypothetical protein
MTRSSPSPDWPGEVLATGQILVSGTGIHVHAAAGRLVMDGTRSPARIRSAPAIPARLCSARLAVDVAAAATATIGLELLDGGLAQRRRGGGVAASPACIGAR